MKISTLVFLMYLQLKQSSVNGVALPLIQTSLVKSAVSVKIIRNKNKQ